MLAVVMVLTPLTALGGRASTASLKLSRNFWYTLPIALEESTDPRGAPRR